MMAFGQHHLDHGPHGSDIGKPPPHERDGTVAGLPVLGTVDTDGKLALTPEGTRILIGETRYGVPLADLAAGKPWHTEEMALEHASGIDEMADALCESAALLEQQATQLSGRLAAEVGQAALSAKSAAIRLYTVARELRSE